MRNDRRLTADTSSKGEAKSVAMHTDNDSWSWIAIAAIFAISTALVWFPVIAGVARI